MKKFLLLFLMLFLLTGCEFINDDNIHLIFMDGENIVSEADFEDITELPKLEKEGYSFVGWFDANGEKKHMGNITESTTLYAKWEEEKFTIRFYNYYGDVISEQHLLANAEIIPPQLADILGYKFVGWEQDFSIATHDLDIFPIYQEKKCLVTFKDADGTILLSREVQYLDTITAPTVQEKEGYIFVGWDQNFDKIMDDLIITAQYKKEEFTVVFKDENGLILSEQKVKYLEDAQAPNVPTKEGYSFIGWDCDYTKVTSNLIVTARYNITSIKVTFNSNGGNNISEMIIYNGKSYELPTPTRDDYIFLKWINGRQEVALKGTADFASDMSLDAVWLQEYSVNGKQIKYYKSSEVVMIPTEYSQKEEEFRGVWVSALTSDVSRYTTQQAVIAELTELLDNMEDMHLNALVYHVRINNDALYDTDLSPKSTYVANASFDEWDYLAWLIDECHNRGIEFHAWLNPYRINGGTVDSIVEQYKDYPKNPASKAENILRGTSMAILNPGEPAVREFLVDTCMEIIRKYDVDAIHFDDYFYVTMDGDADIETYKKYKSSSSATNIRDWRREQVNIFIENLSSEIRKYNTTNHRDVELGISPSGIWRNGNGVVTYDENGTAITNGSNTAGMEHYDGYLFADTKKWIDEEWIDYILPQSYWSFDHPVAGYADVIDWWAKVVKNKDVKLYSGIGIYRSDYGWGTNAYEVSDQILYNTKYAEIDGACFFRYKFLLSTKNKLGNKRLFEEYWNSYVLPPK